MTAVLDAKPPLALVGVMNLVLRVLLRTPAGRLVRPFGLLEFTGRRSGRRYRVPVGVHQVAGAPVVFTPAPWRANFAGGLAVVLRLHGRADSLIGDLDADPASVAALLQTMFDDGTPPWKVGLRIAPGHRISSDDVVSVDRQAITFRAR